MMEFGVAKPQKAKKAKKDEDVVEVPIEGIVYKARRPTVAQGVLMARATTGGADLSAVFSLIEALLGTDALEHIERLVWSRQIEMGDLLGGGTEMNPDHGLVDGIFAEFQQKRKDGAAARPTKPSSASSSSRATGGRRSTGRSPGKGSIQKTSGSSDSPTTSTSGPSSASTPKPRSRNSPKT